MSAPCEPDWWLILPAKGAPRGKSRLAGSGFDRSRLSRAVALDSLEVAASVAEPARVVLVSDDPALTAHAQTLGARVLADPGTGLNDAIRHAHNRIRATVATGSDGIAVLLADVPSARSEDLKAALEQAAGHYRAFVPDRDGSGTVLLTDRTGRLDPSFGPGSAIRHERTGHVRLELDLPRLRTDVDCGEDLLVAAELGCGRHTRAVLDPTSARGVAG